MTVDRRRRRPARPLVQISIPGMPGRDRSIVDLGPIATPTPTGTPLPPTVHRRPDRPRHHADQPTPTPTPDGNGEAAARRTAARAARGRRGSGDRPTAATSQSRPATLNSKKLVSELERQAKKAGRPAKRPRARDRRRPDARQPDLLARAARRRPDRRPELLHRQVPDPAVPAPDLPGRRHRVRRALGGPGGDQRDRDRLRPQPQRLLRRRARAGCSSCPRRGSSTASTPTRTACKDPYNPADAIFATARYLRAAGAEQDLRKAIFAYNHADWYVDSVLMRARLIGGLPSEPRRLAHRPDPGPLPGRRQGHLRRRLHRGATPRRPASARASRVTVHSWSRVRSTAAGSRSSPAAARRSSPSTTARSSASATTSASASFVELQDTYGNTYTYARLKKVSQELPGAEAAHDDAEAGREGARAPAPRTPRRPRPPPRPRRRRPSARPRPSSRTATRSAARPSSPPPRRRRSRPSSACSPTRSGPTPGAPAARSRSSSAPARSTAAPSFKSYFSKVFGLDRKDVRIKRLRPGSRVVAGTILGRIGKTAALKAPHMLFEIRPAGRGAPRIDPKPILDGWKLLESTAIYRAAGKNPFFGPDAKQPTIGQILLMSKEALVQHVLANPRIEIYACGRSDIQHRPDRPPRAGDARVPRRLRPAGRRSRRSSAATR